MILDWAKFLIFDLKSVIYNKKNNMMDKTSSQLWNYNLQNILLKLKEKTDRENMFAKYISDSELKSRIKIGIINLNFNNTSK